MKVRDKIKVYDATLSVWSADVQRTDLLTIFAVTFSNLGHKVYKIMNDIIFSVIHIIQTKNKHHMSKKYFQYNFFMIWEAEKCMAHYFAKV